MNERELHLGAELSKETAFVAFSSPNSAPFKAVFIEKLNTVLEKMRANGDIEKIMARCIR